MASSSLTFSDQAEKMDSSYLEEDVGITEDIFLSHSGEQKAFVEFLYGALRRANQTAFFDRHSLPKAAPFPAHIKRAAGGCKLGVLVLSDDYLTSKWPMLELEIMVDRKIKLFPLFYRLSPKDLKCPQKLSDWQCAWDELVDKKDEGQAKRWAEAVRKLRSYNGEIFRKGGNEFDYIEKVVTAICASVPSRAVYDLSSIEGHQHLSKEIGRHFDSLVEYARRDKRACMVGLYGVGGLGKTTLCKTMVNHYTSLYLGRSCLIEFPTNGDKGEIVRVCKMALKKLDYLSDRVLEVKDSFDEVIQLVKDHVTKYDVFLAIDNVWPKSEEEAERLLGVGFTADSKILLTSRSEQVLRKVLFCHMKNSYICSLPTPNYEDALKIFQNSLKIGDLTLQFRKQIETFVEEYRFDGKYHPLALKALAGHLWCLWDHGNSETNSQDWACILGKVDTTALQSLHDAIKLSYDGLPQHKKQMFFDIALWIPHKKIGFYYERTMANAVQWLRFFFESFGKSQIKQCIRELGAAGLIQIEIDTRGEEMIGMHDLYFDLAQKEAISARFLTVTEEAMEGMMWERPERLFLEGVTGDQCMKKLQQLKCPRLQLQLMYVANVEFWRTIHLPPLRVLILKKPRPVHRRMPLKVLTNFDKLNLKGFIHLKFLSLQDCDFVNSLEALRAICNLQMLHIEGCVRLQNLDDLGCLTKLEALKVENCKTLKKLPDLGGLTGLERLTLYKNDTLEKVSTHLSPALKEVTVECCGALKKLPDLGGVTALEKLTLIRNGSLEDVSGHLSSALKDVTVEWCGALKKLPGLGGVTGLERLKLYGNYSLEVVSEHFSPALKEVTVESCWSLKKLPDLGGVTGLERLKLIGNGSLEELSGRFSPSLKEVTVGCCRALKKLPDLGSVTGLERLRLFRNGSLEEVSGRPNPALNEVTVQGCGTRKKLPDLGDVTSLGRLTLYKNEASEEVSGRRSPAFKEVYVEGCWALKKLPDLGGVTGLERLTLDKNDALEEVSGCLNPALKEVSVRYCRALKKLPGLGGVTGLERLKLYGNDSLEEVSGRLSPALKEVIVERCMVLKELPDLGGVTGLERLTLYKNELLEEVSGRLSAALKEVTIQYCGALKKLPDLDGVTGLERLTLDGNDSLEEVSGRLSSALKEVTVQFCGALKKLHDLGGVTGLESLTLMHNGSLEEVSGHLSPALKEVYVYSCRALKKLPDLAGLTGLERLTLDGNDMLEEVSGRLCPALKELTVCCRALKKLPDLGGVTGLEILMLEGVGSSEEVSGCVSPALREFIVGCCSGLKKVNNLGGATGLETITLYKNESLEEVSGHLSPALKWVSVEYCGALKKLPDLGGVTGLESLNLYKNDSLEEVSGRRSPALRRVSVERCGALKKLLDFGCVTGLERVPLYGNNSLEEVGLESLSSAPKKLLLIYECPLLTRSSVLELSGCGWSGSEWQDRSVCQSAGLHHLRIEDCSTVDVMDVRNLMDLRRLEVKKCGKLEAIMGLDALWKLEEVVLYECGCLEDRDGAVSALSRKRNLKLVIDGRPRLS